MRPEAAWIQRLAWLRRLDFRPDAVAQALGGGVEGARPLPAFKNLAGRIKAGRVPDGLREKEERGPVGGGGAGGLHDLGRDGGAQQVLQELMRQAGAAAFAQDDGTIAVEG